MAEIESSTLPAVSQFDENSILACNYAIQCELTRQGLSRQEATALINIAGKGVHALAAHAHASTP
jgi:hypothetical protein